MGNFNAITESEMSDFMSALGFTELSVEQRGSFGRRPVKERVYETPVGMGRIRVYSSVVGPTTRERGKDAIRVQYWVGDQKVYGAKRVHRTQNWRKNLLKRTEEIRQSVESGPLSRIPKDSRGDLMTVRGGSHFRRFWGSVNYPDIRESRRFEAVSVLPKGLKTDKITDRVMAIKYMMDDSEKQQKLLKLQTALKMGLITEDEILERLDRAMSKNAESNVTRKTEKEEIILEHLNNNRQFSKYDGKIENTEGGVAQLLGITRSGVSKTLRDMEAKGLIYNRNLHVPGGRKKVQCWFVVGSGVDRGFTAETIYVRQMGDADQERIETELRSALRTEFAEMPDEEIESLIEMGMDSKLSDLSNVLILEDYEAEYEQAFDISMACPKCDKILYPIGEGGDRKSEDLMHFEYYCDCDEKPKIVVSPDNRQQNWELSKANPCSNCGDRYEEWKQVYHPITGRINKNATQYWTMCEVCHKGFCGNGSTVANRFCQTQDMVCNDCEPFNTYGKYRAESFGAESFKPPASAVAAAKRGLAQRKKYGRGGLSPAEAKSQGIDSGVTRARKIASGKVSKHDVRRMSAFNRHRKNNRPEKKMPDGGPTAGTIAWNLWGGTSGVNWAKKKSAAMNAETVETMCRQCKIGNYESCLYGETFDTGGFWLSNCVPDPSMNAETFEAPVTCDICGKTFDSFRGLNGHMNAHLPPHRKRAEDWSGRVSLSKVCSCGRQVQPYDFEMEYDEYSKKNYVRAKYRCDCGGGKCRGSRRVAVRGQYSGSSRPCTRTAEYRGYCNECSTCMRCDISLKQDYEEMGRDEGHEHGFCHRCYDDTGRYGAEEKLSKTSCCCGATELNPCACMKAPEPMSCSATEPKCACYKALEKNAESEDYGVEPRWM